MAGTVVGEGLSIEGDLSSDEEVVVHGSVRGKLTTSDQVSIGGSGVVQADVSGSSVSIAGQVTGDVTASAPQTTRPNSVCGQRSFAALDQEMP